MAKKSVRKTGKNRKVSKKSLANLKGVKGEAGPGRPKGSKNHDGLNDVLNMLKDFISDKKNLEALKKDFQQKFNSNPSGFYYKMVMPLLPKTIDINPSETMSAYIGTMQQIFSKAENGAKKKKR